MKRVLCLLALAGAAAAQTSPESLMVSRIYNITSAWAGECAPGVVLNTSQYTRRNNFHTLYASGAGTWTVAMKYSDTSCSGPWSAFGSPTSISQADSLTIITAVGYHPYIQIAVTGAASATYAAAKDFFPGSVGAVGPAGQGVPVGGATDQVLAKGSAADYDTHWVDQSAAGNFTALHGTGNPNGTVTCTSPTYSYLDDFNKHLYWCTAADTWTDMTSGAAIWGQIGGTLALQTDLQNALNAKSNTGHTHAEADISNLTTDLAAKEALANKGAASGYVPLNSLGKIDTVYLPASSGITAISQDDHPQLGGNLDMSGFSIQTVTPTEMTRLHGVTGAVQTQIDAKAALDHTHTGVYEPVDATILRQANLAGSGAALTPARSDHNHAGTYIAVAGAYTDLSTSSKIGTGATQVAAGNHTHAGTYEPVDTTILRQSNLAGTGVALTPARSDHNHTATYAPLVSPALTGTPTAPTAAAGTNTTQVATTAYVDGARVSRNPSAAYDSAPTGSELVSGTGWTATGWSGSYPSFTHTAGNTTALTNSVAVSSSTSYRVGWVISGRTAGSVLITIGNSPVVAGTAMTGNTYVSDGTYVAGLITTDTSALTFTPTTDFDGTISAVSVKPVTGVMSPLLTTRDSSGAVILSERRYSGVGNIYEGYQAGENHLSAIGSVFIGHMAGYKNFSAPHNVCVGMYCGYSNWGGWDNAAVGYSALYSNTIGWANAAFGSTTLLANTTGHHNSAFGDAALNKTTTGNYMAALGASACIENLTGSGSVCIGTNAGNYTGGAAPVTALENSVVIGFNAQLSTASDTNTIVIGNGAAGNGSNTATIGNDSITDTYLKGEVHGLTAAAITAAGALTNDTSGTAANLSGTPALPNGTAATTQTQADNSTKLATTAYVDTLGATKQATSAKDTNGGYVGRDSSGNSTIPGTMTAGLLATTNPYSASGPAVTLTTGSPASSRPACSTTPIGYLASDTHALTVCNTATSTWGETLNPPGSYAQVFNLGTGKWECYTDAGASCTPTSTSGGSVSVNGTVVSDANFNSTAPTADSGYTAIPLKVSGSDVIVQMPYTVASASNHCSYWVNPPLDWNSSGGVGQCAFDADYDYRYAGGRWQRLPHDATWGTQAVAKPNFDYLGGTYNNDVSVAMTTTTSGATICYTTDGVTPAATTAGTCDSDGHTQTYSTAVSVGATATTVKAIGTKAASTNSTERSELYTLEVGAITADPVAGTYTSEQSVTLSAATTTGYAIHYRTDGTAAACSDTTYTGAITVSATTTITAIACKTGYVSSTFSGLYTLQLSNITYVTAGCGGATSGAGAAVATINSTGATRLYAYVNTQADDAGVVNTLSDNLNAAGGWTLVRKDSAYPNWHGYATGLLYYINNPTVGAGHEITFSSSSAAGYPSVCVLALAGGSPGVPDTNNGYKTNMNSGVTTAYTGEVVPPDNNEVLVTGMAHNAVSTSSFGLTGSGGGSYTLAAYINRVNQQHYSAAIGYSIQTTATTDNLAWSGLYSTTSSAVGVAVFK